MSSREELQAIASGVMLDLVGQAITTTDGGGNPIAVWPAAVTGGKRATQVMLRPVTNPVWIRINIPSEIGGFGAQLSGDVEYVLPLGPSSDTIYFAAPATTTVLARWAVGDV